MATKLIPVGSEFQVNSRIFPSPSPDGTAFGQQFPAIATLTDGRFAVVYQSQSNAADTDIDIHYAFVNPDGTAAAASFVYRPLGLQTQPVAAGRPGGGFGVAWTDSLTSTGASDVNPNNINFRTVVDRRLRPRYRDRRRYRQYEPPQHHDAVRWPAGGGI
jgi:hypothetical protein